VRIEEIEIKNLKSVTKLSLSFEKDSLGLLYGSNGIGKTTALEAISLLGHLSCMRRFEVHDGNKVTPRSSKLVEGIKAKQSRFENPGIPNSPMEDCLMEDPLAFNYLKEQLEIKLNQSPKHWFWNHRWGDDIPGAAIRYKVSTGIVSDKDPIEFYVYFNQTIVPLFCVEDFIDIKALLKELKGKTNPWSSELYSWLSSRTCNLVDKHNPRGVATKEITEALCDDFNLVLQTRALQNVECFRQKESDLSEEMRELFESKKDKGQRLRNRRLLEVAFPRMIQRRYLKELSITQALSRRSSNDVEMNNLFAVIYSSNSEPTVRKFIEYLHKNSSYIVPTGKNNKLFSKEYNPNAEHGLVSFINTDLNDFGRMNDVRESVKDIRSNFAEEIVERLRLPFGKEEEQNGDFRCKESLNVILRNILREYRNFNPHSSSADISDEPPTFEIEMLDWDAGTKELTFVAKRRGKKLDNIDYLSAGENESFFIFLLLLGFPRNSIILLDEPDLHLTTFAKSSFFEKLYSLMAGKECQVILATHSLFAHPDKIKLRPIEVSIPDELCGSNAKSTKVKRLKVDGKVIQVDPKVETGELKEGPDTDLAWEFFKHYFITAWRSFRRISRLKILWQLLIVYAKTLGRELGYYKLYRLIMTLLIGAISSLAATLLVGIVSLSFDMMLSTTGESFESHKKWAARATDTAIIFIAILLATVIVLLGMTTAMLWKRRRKRKH
jgi:predicted ATPase